MNKIQRKTIPFFLIAMILLQNGFGQNLIKLNGRCQNDTGCLCKHLTSEITCQNGQKCVKKINGARNEIQCVQSRKRSSLHHHKHHERSLFGKGNIIQKQKENEQSSKLKF